MMEQEQVISSFLTAIQQAISDNTFVKLSLGHYKGQEESLKQIHLRRITIKGIEKMSFTYRYQRRDVAKNYTFDEALTFISQKLNASEFLTSTLFTIDGDIIYERNKRGKGSIRRQKPVIVTLPDKTHDHNKQRPITASKENGYLHYLGITDQEGKVYQNTQNKYRQINHYITLLKPLIEEAGIENMRYVADMGAGKGYLTFALYDFLTHSLGVDAIVQGVEFRKDLVAICNEIAQKANFENLSFIEGEIANTTLSHIDLLIALHACDTATDDAIYKGIINEATLIVVAPCCHKQIRRELEREHPSNEMSFMTKHGILLERHAEMLTDGLRALYLEYFGYKTNVLQFIAEAHTAKNLMITAIKKKNPSDEERIIIRAKIDDAKSFFGIKTHYLEQLLPF